jgi:hypothetical protein
VPVRHGLLGLQLPPLVQAVQTPALQTLFVPQSVPLARLVPVSEQVIDDPQLMLPAWQGLAGVQDIEAVQEVQVPLLQTMFVPQLVPLAAFADSVHTGLPVPQLMVPTRQGLPLIGQEAPVWQATQVPAPSQTLLVPQLVPGAAAVPLSLQTGAPVPQASVP